AFSSSQSRSSRLRCRASSPNSASGTCSVTAVRPAAARVATGPPLTPVSSPRLPSGTAAATAYTQMPWGSVIALIVIVRLVVVVAVCLQGPDPRAEPAVLLGQVPVSNPLGRVGAEPRVGFPPVDAHLLGRV